MAVQHDGGYTIDERTNPLLPVINTHSSTHQSFSRSCPAVFLCNCGNIVGDNHAYITINSQWNTISLHSARQVLLTPDYYTVELPFLLGTAKAKCVDIVCAVCGAVIGRVYSEVPTPNILWAYTFNLDKLSCYFLESEEPTPSQILWLQQHQGDKQHHLRTSLPESTYQPNTPGEKLANPAAEVKTIHGSKPSVVKNTAETGQSKISSQQESRITTDKYMCLPREQFKRRTPKQLWTARRKTRECTSV